jgi:uncharacterized protein (TIGR01777 family)
MPRFVRRARLPVPAAAAFAWHARPGAFERLAPPWQTVRVVERTGGITDGSRLVMAMRMGPLTRRWVAHHTGYVEGREFTDVQAEGPFAAWRHTHRVLPDGPDASVLEDEIDYALPAAPISELLAGGAVDRMLDRLFAFRHARTRDDLARHAAVASSPLRIAVTGASGLVGSQLAAFLTTGGHTVLPLVRRAPRPRSDEIAWDPARGEIDAARLDGVDAVVHLAGEPVAARWTDAHKARVRASRVDGTRLLATTLARLASPPRVLVSASAIGFYGDRGDEPLDERSAPGTGFLAEVCREWEAATEPAAAAGIRVVHPRIGVVLAGQGGALATMATPFRLGLGGVVGDGSQMMSWIALDDLVGALHHLLFADVHGPVNATAPEPVSNATFVQTLGAVLRRPTMVPMPARAARLLFGDMGEALLLAGARVLPRALLASGFRFLHADLASAMRDELGA